MEISITSSSVYEKVTLKGIIDKLQEPQCLPFSENSNFYTDFPVFKEVNQQPVFPDATLLSRRAGIILFFIDESSDRTFDDRKQTEKLQLIDQVFTSLFSMLIKVPALRQSRLQLVVPISVIYCLPNYQGQLVLGDYEYIQITRSVSEVTNILAKTGIEPISDSLFDELCGTIEGTRAVHTISNRDVPPGHPKTKGALLDELQSQIAVFDNRQKIAAISQTNGPQRIRGLAGSGKTVILAMKAAQMHLRNPQAKILYTFWTKSLYDHVRSLITKFYRIYQTEDPNWERLHVRHAWGGANIGGVYYDTCLSNGVEPMAFQTAKQNAGKETPFDYICRSLLKEKRGLIKQTYDYVLLDEGQDFNPPFYWLCRKLVKNDCIVWAYDDLQNVLNVNMQDAKKLFQNEFGDSGIDLEELGAENISQNTDIILHRCYRNPREILVIAHAIGFGIYNSDHILQMLENKAHWHDLGYEVIVGSCTAGETTVIERPSVNSPSLISDRQTMSEMISINAFTSISEEVHSVSLSIEEAISQKLLPEDIMVICLDDRNARVYFNAIERMLAAKAIGVNNMLNTYAGDHFVVKGAVTLSTVYRAKGNEAALVFIIGADAFDEHSKNDIIVRNRLFTAFTRAMAWINISGCRSTMNWLIEEVQRAVKLFPRLEFVYPDLDKIRLLRREFTEKTASRNVKLRHIIEEMDSLGLTPEEIIQYESKYKSKKTTK